MKSLTLRIYLAVVAVLLLFAVVAAWVAKSNLDHDREHHRRGIAHERYEALGELIENSMPDGTSSRQAQADALLDLSTRLRVPMALDDGQGRRIVAAPPFEEWARHHAQLVRPSDHDADDADEVGAASAPQAPFYPIVGPSGEGLYRQVWSDGRVLWLLRPPRPMMGGAVGAMPSAGMVPPPPPAWLPFMPWLPADLLLVLLLLFIAVALGAWPVARHLTRRLKLLQQGVERFGDGQLQHRVAIQGHDEVAELAHSFNQAADRIESLVVAHRSLLANASHELRSPLARLKMAVSLMYEAPPQRLTELQQEIHQDIRELDELVEEVLLASRLDAQVPLNLRSVDVVGLLVEEAQHIQANAHVQVHVADIKN